MIRVSVTSKIKAYGVEMNILRTSDIIDVKVMVEDGDVVILVYDEEIYNEFAKSHQLPEVEMLEP